MNFQLRQAVRSLLRKPAYAAMATITLALGIACATVMFSFVNGVLLRPLPYPNSDRIVTLLHDGVSPVSPADLRDWQRQARGFSQMEAASVWSATMTGGEQAEHLTGLQLTRGMFQLLGDRASVGRTFSATDANVVVLSHGFWQRAFGGRNDAIGKTLRLSGEAYTVIGMMPPDFRFTPFWVTGAEFWVPLDVDRMPASRNARMLRVFGLLAPGSTLARAQAKMDTICGQLAAAYPDSNARMLVTVQSLAEKVTGPVRTPLLVMMGAVGLLMLLACSNIAGLTLARSLERRKEIGIRVALGAGRSAILGQMLLESLVLALFGGALGVAFAVPGLELAKSLLADAVAMPRLHQVALDPLVLVFAVLVSAIAGVVAGLAPAWQTSQLDTNTALKDTARGSSEGRGSMRLRSLLVCGETALCVVLLAAAGVLTTSYLSLRGIAPGFEPGNLLSMTISVAGLPNYVGERRDAFYDNVLASVRAVPGVTAASMVNHPPAGGDAWGTRMAAEGSALPRSGEELTATWRVATPGYFDTLKTPIDAGRDFTRLDRPESPRVVIVNQAAAEKLWPGQNPVGKRLTLDDPRKPNPDWAQVVGMIRNMRHRDWTSAPGPEVYLPYLQVETQRTSAGPASAYITLVVRASSDPGSLGEPIRRAIAEIDRAVPVSKIRTFAQILDGLFASARFAFLLTVTFALFALLLASLGLFGVMSYSVRSRAHEVGIRMALGATRANILGMVLKQGLGMAAAGGAAGLVTAAVLARSLTSFVYGVSPADPASFLAAGLLMLGVATLAVLIPALRAASLGARELRLRSN